MVDFVQAAIEKAWDQGASQLSVLVTRERIAEPFYFVTTSNSERIGELPFFKDSVIVWEQSLVGRDVSEFRLRDVGSLS